MKEQILEMWVEQVNRDEHGRKLGAGASSLEEPTPIWRNMKSKNLRGANCGSQYGEE